MFKKREREEQEDFIDGPLVRARKISFADLNFSVETVSSCEEDTLDVLFKTSFRILKKLKQEAKKE